MHRKFAHARRFAPSLESLDGRFVPSCTWVQAGGVLTVTGDASANVVSVTDDGAGLTVTCDGEAVDLQGDVTKVVVNLGAGDDSVTYTRVGHATGTTGGAPGGEQTSDPTGPQTGDPTGDPAPATPTARSLEVNLGGGRDAFIGHLTGALIDGDSLALTVLGGNGQDQLSFAADGVNVGAGATVSVDFRGGTGQDLITYRFSGLLSGDVTLSANGGKGMDFVSGEVVVGGGSTGSVDVEALGGKGADDITLQATDNSGADTTGENGGVTGPSTLTAWHAAVDGGRGQDTIEVTDSVEVTD